MEKLITNFKISFTKGDTYALAVKFKDITEDLSSAFFTVKENPDDEPLIQKTLGAGIDKIDDRAYKREKTYKLQIQAEDTANLEACVQYLYDLQVTIDNVVKTVLSGVFVVTHSVTGVSSISTPTLEAVVQDEVVTELATTPAVNGIEYEQDPIASAKIGDLSGLSTTAKETLVLAINEVKNGNTAILEVLTNVMNGTTPVQKASTANHSLTADHSTTAGLASSSTEANHALSADEATKASKVVCVPLSCNSYESNVITEYGLYIINYSHIDDSDTIYQTVVCLVAGSGSYKIPIYNEINDEWGEISFNWTDRKFKITCKNTLTKEEQLKFVGIRYVILTV